MTMPGPYTYWNHKVYVLGADSISRWCLSSIGIPIMKIRQSHHHLDIFTIGFPILLRWHFYCESGLWWFHVLKATHMTALQDDISVSWPSFPSQFNTIPTFGNRCLSAIGGGKQRSRLAGWVQLSAEAAPGFHGVPPAPPGWWEPYTCRWCRKFTRIAAL